MSMEVADRDPITNLQSLVDSLKHRVQELEVVNAKLSSQLANCCCHEKEKKPDGSVSFDSSVEKSRKSNSGSKKTTNEKVKETVPGHITRIMNYLPKRYVALKVMYFGQRFYGFASEAQMDPTIESEIFKALEKTRLLVGDKKESQYSRCGRTDKGVSAVGQVIALYLRSNLKETCENNEDSNKIVCNEQYEGEIDYVRVLNRALPEDIRVFGWCPVPLDFNARFDENQLWAIKIKGSAFLWHQVRCMVAVLFLIGQGHESPDVVDALLDTSRTPRKPQYTMAPEIPLVLQSCEFEGLKFTCSSDAGQALRVHLAKECQSYHLQAAIFHEALRSCLPIEKDQSSLENRTIKKKCAHVPLVSRPTERKCYRLFVNRIEPIITRKVERCAASYDERRAKLNSKA
ncbi:tRNA pseudouridine(38/39) synthase isoform X4 [Pyrus x bretschneideri]|uniref:tRNA pseudouridine(38/39) synthase isoform X4 n=1 Tax=Pyrus x bretschneideri TaxID=225117 RepID=UPI00202DB80C|nr:tRNA pseudouridine(38/39) synthase isoform X4 [Pyrus x bretschneideri]